VSQGQPEVDSPDRDSLHQVRQQLERGREQLRAGNPALYRDLALYLQVLRELLPGALEQATFYLVTRVHPERYSELPAERRRGLHTRSTALLGRCASFLTVEQLAQLAGTLAARRRGPRPDLLAQLQAGSDEGAAAPPLATEPEGSVRLALEPPVDLLGPGSWSWPPDGDRPGSPEPADGGVDACSGPDPDDGPQPAPLSPPWDSPCLPDDPAALLDWMEGWERALVRRLRDLSHALNGELLRSGLSRSRLPLAVLEAALQGQVEARPAPANLLRLQLPVAHPLGGQLESVALLLRPADLELEHPRLRSCRARLQRHRQAVRRMAEQHRRLRRRLQALEAERLWHQENPRSHGP
jgi:hypothetical protein